MALLSPQILPKCINNSYKQSEQIKIFMAENGNCNVPCKYPKNPKLGRWVHTQRNQRKNGELSAERIEILDGIGFWDYLPQEALK
jgi:hypothetical protein